MSIFDTILIVILAGFVFYGLFFGLIRTLGTFLGMIIGAVLASRLYLLVFEYIAPMFFGRENLGKVLTFIILFILINRLVGLVFYLIEGVFKVISIIPFLKTINRLAGAILGFLTGAFSIGLVLFVASRYSIIGSLFGRWLMDSDLAPMFLKFVNLLLPLLPEMLKKLQSLI